MTNNEIIKCLDERQLSVCDNLPSEHWLSNKNNLLKFYEWNTFFRENLDMYAEIYFGFALYPYQHLELYELNKNTLIDITGSRATAKTYIIAIFAVCKASLYPNSKIVICSATKGQSKLVVSEKIKNELMSQSPMLCREIKSIKDNQNDVIVYFRNGSTIKVLPSSENARGNRSTVTIYEENRMIDKFIIDSVISPFAIIRPVPYLKYEEYADLVEEPTEVYISSAWYASHWMNTLIQDTYKAMLKGEKQCVIGLDYSVSLKHKIKTKNQILKDKRKFDPITFRIEYNNEMIKENTSAFFTYKMFTDNQRNKKPLYPRFDVDVLSRRKNPYSVSKQQGEIRILSCDMAFAEGKHNDNSIFTCMRLIPESTTYTVQSEGGTSKEISQGYRKIVSYIESIQGGDITKQAIRIKQLYEDLSCDYVVLDTRNGGLACYDLLAKVMYDESRDKEYQPWVCMNDDSIANRIKTIGALPVLFAINASQKLNSEIANEMRIALTNNMIDFLIPFNEAVESTLTKIPEYMSAIDVDIQLFYEQPYLETQELINECVELTYERKEQTGLIVISEQGANRKDRYTSVSYGVHFASLLEQDLLSDNSDYDYVPLFN